MQDITKLLDTMKLSFIEINVNICDIRQSMQRMESYKKQDSDYLEKISDTLKTLIEPNGEEKSTLSLFDKKLSDAVEDARCR